MSCGTCHYSLVNTEKPSTCDLGRLAVKPQRDTDLLHCAAAAVGATTPCLFGSHRVVLVSRAPKVKTESQRAERRETYCHSTRSRSRGSGSARDRGSVKSGRQSDDGEQGSGGNLHWILSAWKWFLVPSDNVRVVTLTWQRKPRPWLYMDLWPLQTLVGGGQGLSQGL